MRKSLFKVNIVKFVSDKEAITMPFAVLGYTKNDFSTIPSAAAIKII